MSLFFAIREKIWPSRIRGQLILGIALVNLIVMSVFVFDIVSRQREFLKQQNHTQAFSFASDYAVNSTPYVISNDFDELERLTISHINYPNLKYAMILSADGVVLAHTNPQYIGKKPTDDISNQLKGASTSKTMIENDYILDIAVPINAEGEMIGWARVGVNQNFIQSNLAVIVREGLIYIFLALLIAVLLAIIIANTLSKGLYKLIATANKIKSGDRNVRAAPFWTSELSELSTAFNRMLDDISANEDLFSMVIENMPVGIWIFNEKREFISGNQAGKQIWGGSKFLGDKKIATYKAWHADTKKILKAHEWASVRAIEKGETTVNEELEIETIDSKRKIILNSAIPLKGKEGKTIGAIAINVDITERKRITEQLALSESTLSSAFQYSAIGMTLVSLSGRFIRVNNALSNIIGYSEKEILSLTFQDITHPDDLEADLALVRQTLDGEIDSYRMEKRYFHKSGKIIWIHLSVSLVRDKENHPLFFISQIEDITERKKIIEQLSLSESILSNAFDYSAIGMAMVSPNGKFLRVNKQLGKMFGYTEDELLSLTFQEITYADDLGEDLDYLQKTLKGEIDSFQMEKRYFHKNGNIIWTHLSVSLVRDAQNQPLFFVSQIEDISERKRAEGIILHEKNLSETIINAMPGIFYLSARNGNLIRWNANLETITGFTNSEISVMKNTDFFDQEKVDYILSKRKEAFLKGKAAAEVEIVTKHKQRLSYYVTVIPILYNNEQCILGIGIDFTEKKQAEFALVNKNLETQERVFELRCLYRVSEMANDKSLTIEQILHESALIIPEAYQNSICFACVSLGMQTFESPGFVQTNMRQETPIKVKGQAIGRVEVNYKLKGINEPQNVFDNEKTSLINSIASILSNAIETRLGEVELKNMAEEFRAIIENTNESILLVAPDYRVLRFNKSTRDKLLTNLEKEIYAGADFREFLYPDSKEIFINHFIEALSGKAVDAENLLKDVHGNEFWIRSRMYCVRDEDNKTVGVVVLAEHVTEKKKTERAILQFSRLYQFTSAINEMMLHAENKQSIFSEACKIAITQGQFSMAWVGNFSPFNDAIEVIARAGNEGGYLENLQSIIALEDFKIGSFANAIHQKKPVYVNDIAGESFMQSWKEEMLKRNYRSTISLPIVVGSRLEAVFTLYRNEAFFFNNEEVKLLQEVTNNIAYAIEKLELKQLQQQTEQQIKESEQKFRTLVEETLVGVFILQDGKLVYVNPQCEKIFGYSRRYLLNDITLEQVVNKDDLAKAWEDYSSEGDEKLENHYFLKARRSDGAPLQVEVIASTISYVGKPAVIGTVIDITEQVAEEKRISKAVTDAQENERQQISMELHDSVKQMMAASLLNVDFLKMILKEENTASPIISNTKTYIREAIEELRRISHQLAPSIDETISLEEKIKTVVNTMNVSNAIEVNYYFDRFEEPIKTDVQLAVYRILQEQLSNILKHANASSVHITVLRQNGHISMSIEDDGLGFDIAFKKPGIGLENIKRRVQVFNGQFNIQSSPGKGCKLDVQIPVN